MTADKIATLRTAKAKSFAIAEELQNRPNPSNKKGQNDRPLRVFAANQTYSNKQYFGGLQHGRGKLKTGTAQGHADQIAIHADLIAIHWDQITIYEDQITIFLDSLLFMMVTFARANSYIFKMLLLNMGRFKNGHGH